MNTVTSVACVLLLGLSACATGSVADDGPGSGDVVDGVSDAGVAADGGLPYIIGAGGIDSGSTVTAPTGTSTSTQPPTSDDAGVASNNSFPSSDDAGSGAFGFDAGFGGFDAGFGGFGGFDAGSLDFDSGGGSTCEGWASPNTVADCYCSANDPSECQPNECFGGYYCDLNSGNCHKSLPSSCSF